MEYEIVTILDIDDNAKDKFKKIIQDYLDNGWKLHGPLIHANESNGIYGHFTRELIKDEN